MADRMNDGGESIGLAPVIPLFGARADSPAAPARERVAFVPVDEPESIEERRGDAPADPDDVRAEAEKALLRKLRTRSLSVVEARRVLGESGLDRADADDLIEEFVRRRYLDDGALAEQLVHAGADRKGQGRQAISLTLAKRGVPRDIADTALADLPDDDAERALEFARVKARSLDRVDDDAAFRRLVGALSRRGYGGSAATSAARTALDERRAERRGGSTSGVRFR
jgi:regulatory protein